MSAKKEIGDPLERLAQTGKIGSASGSQKSGLPTTQTASSPAVQTSSNLEVQQSKSLATQTSSSLKVQNASDSAVQQSSSPEVKTDRVQRTIYLSPGLAKWIKIRAAIEEREISALAEDAFLLYRQAVERGEYGN
jgi:hypothetical protein